MWVRFLLPLFLINKKKIYFNRPKNILINFKNKKRSLKTNYFSFKNLFFISKQTNSTHFTYVNKFNNKNIPILIKYFFYNLNHAPFFFKNFITSKSIFLNNLLSLFFFFNSKSNFFFYSRNFNLLFSFFFFNNNYNIFSLKNNFFSKITTFNKISNFFNLHFIFFDNRFLNKVSTRTTHNSNFFNKANFIKKVNLRKFLKKRFLIKLIQNLRIYFLLNKKITKLLGNFFKIKKEDWLNDNLARLTKQSFKIKNNDFWFFKKTSYFLNKNSTLTFFLTNNFGTDKMLEDNLYVLFKFRIFKKFQNSLKKNKLSFQPLQSFRQLLTFNSFNLKNNYFNSSYKSSYKSIFSNKLKNNFSILFFFNKIEFLIFFFLKPIFFKFFFSKNFSNYVLDYKLKNFLTYQNSDNFFYNNNYNLNTNLTPASSFFYILKKKMLQVFNYDKFPITTSIWFYETLIKFLEYCSGKKINLNLYTFLHNNLNFSEKSQCILWARKVKYFRKVLGPRLFLNESLQIIYLSLKLKDPFFLSNWIVATMQKIDFYKYKTFLRYLKYVLRYFFWVIFKELNIKGVKFQLKGKISVAGNARTRTARHSVGATGHATFNNKILYKLNLIRTFTGVLGLKLWISF